MRHLAFRIVAGFLAVIVATIALAVYADLAGERALRQAVMADQEAVATRVLAVIEENLSNRLDQVLLESIDPDTVSALQASNQAYEQDARSGAITSARDSMWANEGEDAQSMADLRETALSRRLQREFEDYYRRRHGFEVFDLVLAADAYGRVVALSGPAASYDQSEFQWWRSIQTRDTYVGPIGIDPDTGEPGVIVAAAVTDDNDNVLGGVRATVATGDLMRFAANAYTGYENTRIKIVLENETLAFSNRAFRFLEDMSSTPLLSARSNLSNSDPGSNSFTVVEGGQRLIYSFVEAGLVGLGQYLPVTVYVGNEIGEINATMMALRVQVLIGAAIFVVLGVVIAFLISSTVTRPVVRVSAAAKQIAQGDLDVSVDVKSRDEVGELAEAFRQMNEALLDMAEMAEAIARGDLTATVEPRGEQDRLGRALSEMQRNLGEQIGQIVEATGTLAASGSQISAFSSQLAASAAESAAAVGETTATVEEVKQTAQLSSEKAKEVSEAAQDTVEVSRRGEQSVSESLELMKQIQQQMQEIGESILKLSEKNQTIGEIIMSVGELSDQSNLLAVNAAIEASRAGEHGKGFTVVAQEIRSLAEQSKKATEQVRGLLNDIQKATNAAVLAMEQGSKAMEQGLEQSAESGEAIRGLTEHIERAAEAATQIAASSRQQLAGMDQVAGAMEAIREATEQNVDSTKQMEHEVQSLAEVGENLQRTAGYYRVATQGGEARGTAE